jgi:anaerobic ribonucleoside-triphosphate reductase activating protein
MNYAQIRNMDISNGKGIGVSLFVSGCHFHCEGCFNKETWDFNYGKHWDSITELYFLSLLSKDYISRVSILGGEPLADENAVDVLRLIELIRHNHPNKKIWLFTGYTMSEAINNPIRRKCIRCADYVVDGRFDINQKDLNLDFRGSKNQIIWTHQDIEEFITKRFLKTTK